MAVKDLRSDLKTKQTTSIPCFSAKFDTRVKMSMKKKYIYIKMLARRAELWQWGSRKVGVRRANIIFFSKLARRISPKVKTARSLKTGLHRACVLSTDSWRVAKQRVEVNRNQERRLWISYGDSIMIPLKLTCWTKAKMKSCSVYHTQCFIQRSKLFDINSLEDCSCGTMYVTVFIQELS